MGRELAAVFPVAAQTFEEADDVLGIALSNLAWEGPEETLTKTLNAQPALLVHSVAVHRVIGQELGPVTFGAGHSLGEFSAHVAAGTLEFADAIEAVRLRGELMFSTGQEVAGAMAAILGLDGEAIEEVCRGVREGGNVCVPANFNSAAQVVVSGDVAGVLEAMDRASGIGARRVVRLNVSGAFHSPLMEPAQEGLREKLRGINFSDPAFPVVSNVTAEPVTSGSEARELLVDQLVSPVRWSASVTRMVEGGIEAFFELGTGTVLCGLNKRNARGIPCVSLGCPDDFDHVGR